MEKVINQEKKRRHELFLEQQACIKKQKSIIHENTKRYKRDYIKALKKRNPKLLRIWRLKKIGRCKLPFCFDFLKWVVIDVLRGKKRPLWGIYLFVAKPGEGKTLSMVYHMEREKKKNPQLNIYTNFQYAGQTGSIDCWDDIINAKDNSIIAIDEVQLTFESTKFMSFPPEMLAELCLNRKSRKQFICSTQVFERVNTNFRNLCNYAVMCKNHFKLDRWFSCYYFNLNAYEAKFAGKKSKSDFIRTYIASDELYQKYNTLEKVKIMKKNIETEIDQTVKENDLISVLDSIVSDNTAFLEKNEIKYIKNISDKLKQKLNDDIVAKERHSFFTSVAGENAKLKKEIDNLKNKLDKMSDK